MTTEDAKTLTTTLNENVLSLVYQPDEHQLEVKTTALPERAAEIEAHWAETQLYDMGVYTRVQAVISAADDHWVLQLKPAAVVNLYNNGTLSKRFVTQQSDRSAITRKRGSYRYYTTVAKDTLESLEWDDKTRIGTYPYISDDGYLGLEFIKTEPPHGLSLQVSSTGSLPIPSAIGAAAELDGHAVEWKVNGDRLFGKTTRKPPVINARSAAHKRLTRLARSTQGNQEHFTCYLRDQQATLLGWEDGDYVDIQVINAGDSGWGLLVTEDIRPHLDIDASCVRKIREYANNQLNFYMPNRIVHGFSLTESAVNWGLTVEGLVGVPEDTR